MITTYLLRALDGMNFTIPSVVVTTPHRGKVEIRHTKGQFIVWSEDGNMRLASFQTETPLVAFLKSRPATA